MLVHADRIGRRTTDQESGERDGDFPHYGNADRALHGGDEGIAQSRIARRAWDAPARLPVWL